MISADELKKAEFELSEEELENVAGGVTVIGEPCGQFPTCFVSNSIIGCC